MHTYSTCACTHSLALGLLTMCMQGCLLHYHPHCERQVVQFNIVSHQSQSLTSLCWSYTCRRHSCRDWTGQILLAHWPGTPPGLPNVSSCYWPKGDCCRGRHRLLLICSRLLIRVGRAPRRFLPHDICPGHRDHVFHCHCFQSCLACSTAI